MKNTKKGFIIVYETTNFEKVIFLRIIEFVGVLIETKY